MAAWIAPSSLSSEAESAMRKAREDEVRKKINGLRILNDPSVDHDKNPLLDDSLKKILMAGYLELVDAMIIVGKKIRDNPMPRVTGEENSSRSEMARKVYEENSLLFKHGTAGPVDHLQRRIRANSQIMGFDPAKMSIGIPELAGVRAHIPELGTVASRIRMKDEAQAPSELNEQSPRDLIIMRLAGRIIREAAITVSKPEIGYDGNVDLKAFNVTLTDVSSPRR